MPSTAPTCVKMSTGNDVHRYGELPDVARRLTLPDAHLNGQPRRRFAQTRRQTSNPRSKQLYTIITAVQDLSPKIRHQAV